MTPALKGKGVTLAQLTTVLRSRSSPLRSLLAGPSPAAAASAGRPRSQSDSASEIMEWQYPTALRHP
jgi:hypothetical protein